MPLNCPVCRAANDAGPACRRCRADLSLCFAVEAQRDDAIVAARIAAAEGRGSEAIRFAETADSLRRGPDMEQLLAALNLLAGDFAAAWSSYLATETA